MTAALGPDRMETLADRLLARPSPRARQRCLRGLLPGLDEQQATRLAEALKDRVIRSLWDDIAAAESAARLILYLARRTGSPQQRALGLRARAQTLLVGQGQPRKALRLYRQALAIHRRQNDALGQALVYLTAIVALAEVGQYRRAVAAGGWSAAVLLEHGQWKPYASLMNNLAVIHSRSLQYEQALGCIEAARQGYLRLGAEGEQFLASSEVNRALALCHLGRFSESLEASGRAIALAQAREQAIIIARARHNLAMTHFLMGRYNHALSLLEQAREAHLAAGQPHEAALCDSNIIDCLVEMNQLEAVVEKCAQVIERFTAAGLHLLAAQAAYQQAQACTRLARLDEAIAGFELARRHFELEKLADWAVVTELKIARLRLREGQAALALRLADQAFDRADGLASPYNRCEATLLAAEILLESGRLEGEPLAKVQAGLSRAETAGWPALQFQALRILARRSLLADQPAAALQAYARAAAVLESLRGQVMLEFRAGFLDGREQVYPELVALCLRLAEPARALEFAERARSQAMLELLSGKADLSLRARRPADEPLVEKITRLQSERQQLARQLDLRSLEAGAWENPEAGELQRRARSLEKQITALWHDLVVRNTDYQQDAALLDGAAALPAGAALPPVEAGTLVLEYFHLEDGLVLFLASAGGVQAVPLAVDPAQLEHWLQALELNFSAVAASVEAAASVDAGGANSGPTLAALERNAQKLLARLYQALLAPARAVLDQFERLVIVPHGRLHYLPFHALYDGQAYLVQTHTIRYLPTLSLLGQAAGSPPAPKTMLAVGHSFHGALPAAPEEARAVAQGWPAGLLLEQEAQLAAFKTAAPGYALLHLACHGEFRPDNPLFSGLALEDGWLTTLDVFNLRLSASLVTLSACQTGRGVVGGGDELSGLMRAFLSSGARSLILSHWSVSDQAAARLMRSFYRSLAAGEDKAAALRSAQRSFLQQCPDCQHSQQHPFYWAPFFLVGDGGKL